MNRADLIEHVADTLDMTKTNAARAVEAVLDGISYGVTKGEDVRLVGFGTFTVHLRPASEGRNPLTGDVIRIPPSRTVRFRAGAALKAAVNSAE